MSSIFRRLASYPVPIIGRLRCLGTKAAEVPKWLDQEEDVRQYGQGGYLPIQLDELFHDRFVVRAKLGWGQQSTVWLAYDEIEEQYVALKVLRSDTKRSEYEKLVHLHDVFESRDPAHEQAVVRLLHRFEHSSEPYGNHFCLVFELAGANLRWLSMRPLLKGEEIKRLARDLCETLEFLHDKCGIIHGDLKPTNILAALQPSKHGIEEYLKQTPVETYDVGHLRTASDHLTLPRSIVRSRQPFPSTVYQDRAALHFKLADFNNALKIKEEPKRAIIQPLAFRAPEVLLGYRWTEKAELWAAALVIYYAWTRQNLIDPSQSQYRTDDAGQARPTPPVADMLGQMTQYFGDIPWKFVAKGRFAEKYYELSHETESKELREVGIGGNYSLRDLLKEQGPAPLRDSPRDLEEFANFLELMLCNDPEKRATAHEVLQHRWLIEAHKCDGNRSVIKEIKRVSH